MNNKKLQEKILKEVEHKWNNETQIGFSELAMQEAIQQTIAEKDAQKDLFIEKLKDDFCKCNNFDKICHWCYMIDKLNKEVFNDE